MDWQERQELEAAANELRENGALRAEVFQASCGVQLRNSLLVQTWLSMKTLLVLDNLHTRLEDIEGQLRNNG